MAQNLEKLRAFIWSTCEQEQCEALLTLALHKDESVFDPCAHNICHGTDSQKEMAFVALGRLGTPKALEFLEFLCNSTNADDRLYAAYFLALNGNRSGERVLLELLPTEKSLHWRLSIIACLAHFGHARI